MRASPPGSASGATTEERGCGGRWQTAQTATRIVRPTTRSQDRPQKQGFFAQNEANEPTASGSLDEVAERDRVAELLDRRDAVFPLRARRSREQVGRAGLERHVGPLPLRPVLAAEAEAAGGD